MKKDQTKAYWLGFAGVMLAVVSSGFVEVAPTAAYAAWVLSFALFFRGCLRLARAKGYSPWMSLFAFLLVPGFIVLLLVPDRSGP